MFPSSRNESRNFFFNTWAKISQNKELYGVEEKAAHIIRKHPEYHHILENQEKYSDHDFSEEIINPFLHLSLHLTLLEQIETNQPHGIRDLFFQLCTKGNYHEAEHNIISILGEEIWNTVRNNKQFNNHNYLHRIKLLIKT